jgi:energy-coupling factor transport system permease protein
VNQFEFLPLITIGQYFPTGSILHRLDARAKLVVFGILILSVTFIQSIYGLLIALAVIVAGILVSKVSLRYALKGLLLPLPFLIVIALIQVLFFSNLVTSTVYFSWGIIHITQYGLKFALMLFVRFIALILGLSLSSFCLSNSEMITGLDDLLRPLRKIGIQTMDLVMVIQVAMRFLPLLAQSAERIAKAQVSRGAEWGTRRGNVVQQVRRVIPLIIPLILTSLRRAESMALAMDARAYGVKDHRTSIYTLEMHLKDWLFILFGLAVTALAIIIK